METVIEIKNLTKYYGKILGVADLNLEITKGEIFGFMGPNGAGKTTTIRCLLDFIRPTSGSVSILGMDAQKKSREIKRHVGFLPSDVRLYEKLTGEQLIKYEEGFIRKSTYAKDLVERLGAELDKKVSQLSKGNKQLVAIVLALMNKPEVLIMDEPTTALDPVKQSIFYEILEEMKDQGTTIFFSSHRLPEVHRMADTVGMIKDGKLVKVQTIEDLEAKEIRTVEIRLRGKCDPDDFKLPGVQRIERISEGVRLTMTGDINPLIHKLGEYDLVDIEISHATVEDFFMGLYEGKEG